MRNSSGITSVDSFSTVLRSTHTLLWKMPNDPYRKEYKTGANTRRKSCPVKTTSYTMEQSNHGEQQQVALSATSSGTTQQGVTRHHQQRQEIQIPQPSASLEAVHQGTNMYSQYRQDGPVSMSYVLPEATQQLANVCDQHRADIRAPDHTLTLGSATSQKAPFYYCCQPPYQSSSEVPLRQNALKVTNTINASKQTAKKINQLTSQNIRIQKRLTALEERMAVLERDRELQHCPAASSSRSASEKYHRACHYYHRR